MQALLLLLFLGRCRWRHFANAVVAAISGTTFDVSQPWESGMGKRQCRAPLQYQL